MVVGVVVIDESTSNVDLFNFVDVVDGPDYAQEAADDDDNNFYGIAHGSTTSPNTILEVHHSFINVDHDLSMIKMSNKNYLLILKY